MIPNIRFGNTPKNEKEKSPSKYPTNPKAIDAPASDRATGNPDIKVPQTVITMQAMMIS
jgi:hypothetical protein